MKKVVIIGAGIGGLATAGYLAKAGYDVRIYEQLDYAGGRAGTLDMDGFHFDIGPSWYLMPEVFEHYFALMGTTAAEHLGLVQLDPAYKVFFGSGKPITIMADQACNVCTFEAVEPGAGAALTRYVAQSSDIYDASLRHFLYTNFQSLRDLLKWDVIKRAPTLLRLTTSSYDHEVRRFVHSSRLQRVLEYSTVFLGASPFDTPAIYTLMATLDYRDGVFYPKGGIATLVDTMRRLAEQAGVKIVYNAPVKNIIVEQGSARGIVLNNDTRVEADIVVSNGDMYHTETALLEAHYQTYPERYWKARNPGPSALMMYLGVRGKLPELEHHSLLFVDEWHENFDAIYHHKRAPRPASIYLSRATATDPHFAPDGHEALVVLVPFPAGIELSHDEYETLADEYLSDIEKMTGISDLRERIVSRQLMTPDDFGTRYHAWQYGALGPAHTLRQTAIFRSRNKSKKVANLYYVGGSTIPGIGMPMVTIGAELVYKHIVSDRRGGPVDSIERHVA